MSGHHIEQGKFLNDQWFLIDSGEQNGFYNMAADEEMLNFEKPVLRIYAFKPFCLTIGYFMNTAETLNIEYLKKNNIDFTRRITGGKAVLHANEITYSLVVPISLFNNSVIQAYKKSAQALRRAFSLCGIKVSSTGEENTSAAAVCFAGKSKYEITFGNKKVAGFAQKKMGDKILQHCSIPFDIDFNMLADCFIDKSYIPENLKNKMAGINQITEKNENYKSFSQKLIHGFSENFNINFSNYEFTDSQKQNIYNQIGKKYVMPCWINKK